MAKGREGGESIPEVKITIIPKRSNAGSKSSGIEIGKTGSVDLSGKLADFVVGATEFDGMSTEERVALGVRNIKEFLVECGAPDFTDAQKEQLAGQLRRQIEKEKKSSERQRIN